MNIEKNAIITAVNVLDGKLAVAEGLVVKGDARIAELESELAARPVVESEAARKLREVWSLAYDVDRQCVADDWGDQGAGEIGAALRAFCESAPPTSAPPTSAPSESNRVLGLMDRNERLREERDAAVEQRRLLTEQLNAQAKSHGEEGERWSREMGELKRELEALKAAPARVEASAANDRVRMHLMRAHPEREHGDAGADHLRDAAKKVAPAPAEERVTLYLLHYEGGHGELRVVRPDAILLGSEQIVAIEARVFRKGGAQ